MSDIQSAMLANITWKHDRLRDINAELVAALTVIVDFCDDPHGSEKPESLACGLARLLPHARAVLAKSKGE